MSEPATMAKSEGESARDDGAPWRACRVIAGALADARKGVARLDHASLSEMGLHAGDLIAIRVGGSTVFRRAMPLASLESARGRSDAAGRNHDAQGLIALGEAARDGLGAGLGDVGEVRAADAASVRRVVLAIEDSSATSVLGLKKLFWRELLRRPAATGDLVTVRLASGRAIDARIAMLEPSASSRPDRTALVVDEDTRVELRARERGASQSTAGYDDLGGLDAQLARVREMIETPIKRPELFERLGVEPPKGVLLSGAPGTGKTLLARAVAEECGAAFFQINGPEIASKHFGESEKQLRDIFANAGKKAPSIVFIDEIDAIAPKRESLAGDRQVERRVVAQLLTLMDGLSGRGQVVVMAATNLPDAIDGALRRPGRFDREIAFEPPDAAGRLAILEIHTRRMPFAADVDLEEIATATHGYVGADLAALAREAAMSALRRTDLDAPLEDVMIEASDLRAAMREIVPTAVREVFSETPSASWADVGGQDAVKRALTEAVIWPLRHRDVLEAAGVAPARGVLLCGPPGTGKTLIARALAHEAGVNFISVRGPQLLTQHFGESEKAVRTVFAKARLAAPCVVFFDEIDAIAPRRGGEGAMDRVVGQLLTELDGVAPRAGVFVLAATNRPDAVDPALTRPGRFDLTLTVAAPDAEARRRILEIHTARMALASDVDLDRLSAHTDGFVGADVEAMCRQAGLIACRRTLSDGDASAGVSVTHGDFNDAAIALRRAAAARGGPAAAQ